MQVAPQLIVLAASEGNQGLLRSTFLFSYSVGSLSEENTGALGQVIAEEAFNPNPVSSHHPIANGNALIVLLGVMELNVR